MANLTEQEAVTKQARVQKTPAVCDVNSKSYNKVKCAALRKKSRGRQIAARSIRRGPVNNVIK